MIKVTKLKKIYKSQIKSDNLFSNFFRRKYRENVALKSISFEIESGELVGFIGPNGAGKTTTLKSLSGILYPTSGVINIDGYTPFEKKHSFLKKIGFIMGQKNQMLWELPATDTYKLNKEIYEIPDEVYKKTLGELTDLMKGEEFLAQPVKTLSLGQRMRAELIGVLLHRPDILFLDEPTIGLDIFAQSSIISFIREYQKLYKSTIILTSHYMKDVERLAKRVILIDQGNIIFDGQLAELVKKHSLTKTVTIVLDKAIKTDDLKLNKSIKYEYLFPQLKIKLLKEEIGTILPSLLKQVEYTDLTIENEPIEEIIKKSFSK